jgi:hypothetical protein
MRVTALRNSSGPNRSVRCILVRVKVRTRIALSLVFAVLGLVTSMRLASGCECAASPPACEAVGGSDLVFLGTVTAVHQSTTESFKTAVMTVDRSFKGELNKTIELFDTGMCDGPDLQVGKQYLMYTSGPATGPVPARGCTRSRAVEFASEDLKFLEDYSAGNVSTHVDGRVWFQPDGSDDDEEKRVPLKGVKVTLLGGTTPLSTRSTVSGEFAIAKVPPSTYDLQAELADYSLKWGPESISVAANGCAEADLLMKVDRRIKGFVLDHDGAPVRNARVEMVSRQPGLKAWEQATLLDVSDEQGSLRNYRHTTGRIPSRHQHKFHANERVPVSAHILPQRCRP